MKTMPATSSSSERLAARPAIATQYTNWLARLMLSRMWERQHNVAMDPPRHISTTTRWLSKTLLPSRIDRSAPIKAPIFILGTPRCGSTLLQDLLCRHDRVGYINYGMDLVQNPELFYAAHKLRTTLGLDVMTARSIVRFVRDCRDRPPQSRLTWEECHDAMLEEFSR